MVFVLVSFDPPAILLVIFSVYAVSGAFGWLLHKKTGQSVFQSTEDEGWPMMGPRKPRARGGALGVKAAFRMGFATALNQRHTELTVKSRHYAFNPRFGSHTGGQCLAGLLSNLNGLLRLQAH